MTIPEGLAVPDKYKDEQHIWYARGARAAYSGVMPPQDATEAHMLGKDVYEAWLDGCAAGKQAAQMKESEPAAGSEAGIVEEYVAREQLQIAENQIKQLTDQLEAERTARRLAENEAAAAKEEADSLREQLEEEKAKSMRDRLLGR